MGDIKDKVNVKENTWFKSIRLVISPHLIFIGATLLIYYSCAFVADLIGTTVNWVVWPLFGVFIAWSIYQVKKSFDADKEEEKLKNEG